MAIQLTVCSLCLERNPETQQAIEQLQDELGEGLQVISLPCMAACDHAPAALIDYDYFPSLSPQLLRRAVLDRSS